MAKVQIPYSDQNDQPKHHTLFNSNLGIIQTNTAIPSVRHDVSAPQIINKTSKPAQNTLLRVSSNFNRPNTNRKDYKNNPKPSEPI